MKVDKWLLEAFKNDPLFQILFNGQTLEMEAFFTFLFEKAEALHEWVIIEEQDGNPVAIAIVETPKSLTGFSMVKSLVFWKASIRLLRCVGFSTFSKLNSYMKAIASARPDGNHYYLILIGVAPKYQKQGYGKYIIEKIHAKVEADSSAIGISLDTENPENVSYYKKLGYKLQAVKQMNSIKIFCMFKRL
jgi:ribosomal protein S18 acetylase RimI-like enzyme